MAHHTDIECWIAGCDWTYELPVEERYKLSQEERDGFVVGHLWAMHSPAQITAELERRVVEVETDRTLTQEQVEDRNAMIRILRTTVKVTEDQ